MGPEPRKVRRLPTITRSAAPLRDQQAHHHRALLSLCDDDPCTGRSPEGCRHPAHRGKSTAGTCRSLCIRLVGRPGPSVVIFELSCRHRTVVAPMWLLNRPFRFPKHGLKTPRRRRASFLGEPLIHLPAARFLALNQPDGVEVHPRSGLKFLSPGSSFASVLSATKLSSGQTGRTPTTCRNC